MSTDALKDKARKFELKEDWNKALDLYLQAIGQEEGSEQPDIGLFNRVGDLQTRIGNNEAAVDHYERAVDLYVEADLANNAIAICKKVIRNLPGRASIYRKMGQIRAAQGFLTDARQNFLTFAEIKQAEGDLEETFNALIEFVELAPEDIEIRLALAGQLETHEREEEAVEQLTEAYRLLITNDRDEEAEAVKEKLGELDPSAVLPDSHTIRTAAAAAGATTGARSSGLGGLEFAYTSHVDDDEEEESAELAADLGEIEAEEEEEEEEEAEVGGLGDFEIAAETEEEEVEALPTIEFDDEEEVEALPTIEFGEQEDEAEEEVEALPTMEFDDEEEVEALPMMEFDEEEEEEATPLPMMEFDEEEEEEEEELVAVVAEEDGDELDATDFGEADDEVHGSSEYVEDTEPLPELEVDLEGLSVGGEEEEVVAEVEEAREEALEEVAFEEAADEEEVVAVAAEEGESVVAVSGEEAVGASGHEAAAESGDLDKAIELIRKEVAHDPNNIDLRQRLVEYAFRKNDDRVLTDAYLELANCLLRIGSPAKAQAVYQQVLSTHPGNELAQAALAELEGRPTGTPRAQVTTSEEYVDLGSMILDDDEDEPTRWVVAADAPTGDDEADFANMLSQFKQKVSEHLAVDDVSAHHDLGTAYMEMGLLDEAVAEFQQALRAAADHLPTYEMLGRCFMEKGDYEIAVKSLSRALEAPYEVEDELIGIYYQLGMTHEELGNKDEAVEFYEKVFSLDINFQDVTERLRALR